MCYETNVYLFDITFFCLFVILTGLDFLDFKLRIYISTCLSKDVSEIEKKNSIGSQYSYRIMLIIQF